jgi:dGTPase
MDIMTAAEQVLHDLFVRYLGWPDDLPGEWGQNLAEDERTRARQIADFIAGMTDRFALIEHERLFDSTPDLR